MYILIALSLISWQIRRVKRLDWESVDFELSKRHCPGLIKVIYGWFVVVEAKGEKR